MDSQTGARIRWGSNADIRLDTRDELIALVQDSKTISSADFVFTVTGSSAFGDADPLGFEAFAIDPGAFWPTGSRDTFAAFRNGRAKFADMGSARLGLAWLGLASTTRNRYCLTGHGARAVRRWVGQGRLVDLWRFKTDRLKLTALSLLAMAPSISGRDDELSSDRSRS